MTPLTRDIAGSKDAREWIRRVDATAIASGEPLELLPERLEPRVYRHVTAEAPGGFEPFHLTTIFGAGVVDRWHDDGGR
jgi:hypothetical protein